MMSFCEKEIADRRKTANREMKIIFTIEVTPLK
jgi:hypothetical protein